MADPDFTARMRHLARQTETFLQECKPAFDEAVRLAERALALVHDIFWQLLAMLGFSVMYRVHQPTELYHPAVLITGTSSGIGRSTALALAHRGYTVLAGVRQPTHGAQLEADMAQASSDSPHYVSGGRLVPVIMDLSSEAAIIEGWQQVEAQLAALNVPLVALVNNAGIGILQPFEVLSAADWIQIFWTNLFGAVVLTRLALPALRAHQGRVINIGSIASWLTPPCYTAYSATKGAIAAWSRALRNELVPLGVAVSIIEPGVIITPGPAKLLTSLKSANVACSLPADATSKDSSDPYSEALAGVNKIFEKFMHQGVPSEHVADAVVHALASPAPRNKYYVGPDARGFAAAVYIFGESVSDWLTRIYLRAMAQCA